MNAIKNLIQDLDGEIAKLTTARTALVSLDASYPNGLQPVVQTPEPRGGQKAGSAAGHRPAVRRPRKATAAAPDVAAAYRREMHPEEAASTPDRKGRAPSAEYVKVLAQARTAPEPFTAASLGVNTGVDAKFCANKLFAWQQKGWVQKVGRGEFKRAKEFPAAAPEAE